MSYVLPIVGLVLALLAALGLFIRWGTRWGTTAEERGRPMPGDAWLEDGSPVRVVMTRAVSIDAPPELVWPWIAQLGRGAGWYSVDWLDNGRRPSAKHIVSWIPDPALGDAASIGYLRHLESGRSVAWWTPATRFVGATARAVFDFEVGPEGRGTRLVSRMSADATGATGTLALWVYRFIDSIMAVRQLKEIRDRAERYGARTEAPEDPETGARDQYQLYEVIYASGESAGVPGAEAGGRWRQFVIDEDIVAG